MKCSAAVLKQWLEFMVENHMHAVTPFVIVFNFISSFCSLSLHFQDFPYSIDYTFSSLLNYWEGELEKVSLHLALIYWKMCLTKCLQKMSSLGLPWSINIPSMLELSTITKMHLLQPFTFINNIYVPLQFIFYLFFWLCCICILCMVN